MLHYLWWILVICNCWDNFVRNNKNQNVILSVVVTPHKVTIFSELTLRLFGNFFSFYLIRTLRTLGLCQRHLLKKMGTNINLIWNFCFPYSKQARVGTLSSQGLCNLLGMWRVPQSLGSWLQRKSSTPKFCPSRKRAHEGLYLVQRANYYSQATKVTGSCS